MAAKRKSNDASNQYGECEILKKFPVSEKIKTLDLVRKEKKILNVEILILISTNIVFYSHHVYDNVSSYLFYFIRFCF